MIETISDAVRGCWRFRWRGLIVAWACLLAGWVFLAFKPNVYSAEATVFVGADVATRVFADLSADGQPPRSDLRPLRFPVSNRDQLKELAHKAGLDQQESGTQDLDASIDRLQQQIWIVDNERWPNVYTANFGSTEPAQSLRVVEALLLVLAQEVENHNLDGGAGSEPSLAEQIAASEARLKLAEQQLTEFKRLNPKITLDDESDSDTSLYRSIEELAQVESRLADAERRREQLQDRLDGHDTEPVTDSRNSTATPEDTLDSRILTLQSRLDRLLQNLAIDHPDVVAARNSLDALHARREQQLVNLGLTASEARSLPIGSGERYRELFKLVGEAKREVNGLRKEVAAKKAQVAETQAIYDVGPEVRTEFESLNGQFVAAQAEHRTLLDSARTAEGIDDDGPASDFRVIKDPALGSSPVSPHRSQWMVWILIASLCVGAALALILNLRKPVFYHGRQVQAATGRPVVAAVTHAWKESVQRRFRRDLVAFSIGILAMVAGSTFVLALQNSSVVMQ